MNIDSVSVQHITIEYQSNQNYPSHNDFSKEKRRIGGLSIQIEKYTLTGQETIQAKILAIVQARS